MSTGSRRREPEQAVANAKKCWICGRTPEQVGISAGHPGQQESVVDRMLAATAESRAFFMRESADWADRVPDQFRTMSFDFVMDNSAEFKATKVIEEADAAKRSLFEPLRMAVSMLRAGDGAMLGSVKIEAGDRSATSLVLAEAEDFERKTGRQLDRDGDQSHPHCFEGMKLGQGISLLRDAAELSYSVQQKLLELEKEDELSRKPSFGVYVAKADGLPGEIQVCTVCQNLVTGL